MATYKQYTKMSKEEDNDLNGLKMGELRKIGKELNVTGDTITKLTRKIKVARKEKEKKKQEELEIRNEELKKRKKIQEEQQPKKETLDAQKMLDTKHPEKAIKAYPPIIVERAKKKLVDENDANEKAEEEKCENKKYQLYCTEETFVRRTWEDLDTQEQLDLLIQAAAEYANEDIEEAEEIAGKKKNEKEEKKAKLQKIEDEMLKKKKEQEKKQKAKELKKMQQHYPMDKVLNEAFLKEKLQKHVYTVFNTISKGGKLNEKEERGFREFITDALWLTNKTAEYGDNQINTMNSLQSYVIFSNVLMMLQNLNKKSQSSILGTRGVNSKLSPLNYAQKQLGITLEWCTDVVSFLDGCIEEGEIRTFYTPKLENNAHIRKHLMEKTFDEDRIAEIESFFNVRLEYATELGLDYEKLNFPEKWLRSGPEWCQAIPIIGKDRPFTYDEDVPEAIIGKKIRLKKISTSTEDNSEGIFYRVINDEKIGDLVVHKIVPFKKEEKEKEEKEKEEKEEEEEEKKKEKVFESFLVHLDLANKKAVQKIDPNKKKEEEEEEEEDAKLDKMDEKEQKELIAIETPSEETKWRQTDEKPKDGRRVRVRTWQEGELRVLSDSTLRFKPYGEEEWQVIDNKENIEVEDKSEDQLEVESAVRKAEEEELEKETEKNEEDEIRKELKEEEKEEKKKEKKKEEKKEEKEGEKDEDKKWIEVVEPIDKSHVRTIKYVEGEFKNGTAESPFTFKPYGEEEWQVIDNKENIEVEDKSEDQLEVESAVRKAEEEELEKETEKNEEDEIRKELKEEEKEEKKKEKKKEEKKEEKEGEKDEVKLDQGDYVDGQEFEIMEMSYPEFEPKTVFFDPRAFAFFIDILSPVLYEGDDVIFTKDDDTNFHYGKIKSVTTGDDDELLYNILENETWSSTFSWSSTVSEKNIVGINHKHLNNGMHKHAVAITEAMKGNTFDDFSLSGQDIVGKNFRYYKDDNFLEATIVEYRTIDNKYKTSDGPDGAGWYDLNNIVYRVYAFEVLDISSDNIVGRRIEMLNGSVWESCVIKEFQAETNKYYVEFDDDGVKHWYDLTNKIYRIPVFNPDEESFDEISSSLVLSNGLVFPYRTQRKEMIPIGTFVGLKLENSKSKFEFAKSLDLEETRYYKTSLPHPGLLTDFREKNGIEKISAVEMYRFLEKASAFDRATIPKDPRSKGLLELSDVIESHEKKMDKIKRKRGEIDVEIRMLEIELQSIKDHTKTAQENRTKEIDKLLNEKKAVQDKIDFFSNNEEVTRELKNKLNKINKDISMSNLNIKEMEANVEKINSIIDASQLQLDKKEQTEKTIEKEEAELKELEEEKKTEENELKKEEKAVEELKKRSSVEKEEELNELEKELKEKTEEAIKIAEGNSDKSGVAYVSTKNKLRIEELRVKKQEYMSELVQIEEEERVKINEFKLERRGLSRAALEELNDLRKLHGIHYVDENPLLTFMRVNDEGKSTLEHILKEEITQEPVNQYSIFYNMFLEKLEERWELEIEAKNESWKSVPKNPFMFYFYLTDEENEPSLDMVFKSVVKKIKGVFQGKLVKDWSELVKDWSEKDMVGQEIGITDYSDNLHMAQGDISIGNYQKLIPVPRTNGKVYRIVLNRTRLNPKEKLLGLTLTKGVTEDNWEDLPPHARTVINGWSGAFKKSIKQNTYAWNKQPPMKQDVLLKVNDEEILEYEDIERLLSVANQETGDEITLFVFRYEHPETVFPDDGGDTFEMDMSNSYEFSQDGKFAFILMMGMVAARVFKKYNDEVDFTKHDVVDLYVDVYEWMAKRQEKYLKSRAPHIPYRMAVSDTKNPWQMPSFKSVNSQSLRNLNMRVLGGRPVCSACQKGTETYYGNIYYNNNLKNLLTLSKQNSAMQGAQNWVNGSLKVLKGDLSYFKSYFNLNMLYSQPRPKVGHHRNSMGLCIESLEEIVDELSTKAQRDANGWFLNWMGTWQEATKKLEKFEQVHQEWYDNGDPRYSFTDWLYGYIVYQLDIHIKMLILRCSDVPIDENGKPIPPPKSDGTQEKETHTTKGEMNEVQIKALKEATEAIKKAIEKEKKKENPKNPKKENPQARQKYLIEIGVKAGNKFNVGKEQINKIAEKFAKTDSTWEKMKGYASGALDGLYEIISNLWEGMKQLYSATKQTLWSIMCCFYKLIVYFCKSEMFRVMIISVVDKTLQRLCENANIANGNYIATNNGKKLNETTGEWVKMSEEEKFKQARAITQAEKKSNWYNMRAFGLVLNKVGNDGSFAKGMQKAVDVKMVGENNFIVGIIEFLQNIPMIGPVLKMTKLEPKEMAEAIAAATALCFQNAWEHLMTLHTSTLDLSKLYSIISAYQECMENAENGEAIMIEQGAAPGGTAPYLNYAWERIVYNIPIYAIVLLNEVQRNELEKKWNREFLGIEDDDDAAKMATKAAGQEASKRTGHNADTGAPAARGAVGNDNGSFVGIGPTRPIEEEYKILYAKFEENKKAVEKKKQEKESKEREKQLAELRMKERIMNEELAALKVQILLEKRRAEVNKSILLKSADAVGSAASTALFGAWKKVREYVPYLGEDEVRALAYKEMQKCILTWMVPGGDEACEVDMEKVGILQDSNGQIIAALEHEEALFKFTYHQNQLQEFASESNAPAASAEEQKKKDNFGARQQKFHGLVRPSVGKYIKWALGEEPYFPDSVKLEYNLSAPGPKFPKTELEVLAFAYPTNREYERSKGFFKGNEIVKYETKLENVVKRLKSELELANNIIKVIKKYVKGPKKKFTKDDCRLLGLRDAALPTYLYDVFIDDWMTMQQRGGRIHRNSRWWVKPQMFKQWESTILRIVSKDKKKSIHSDKDMHDAYLKLINDDSLEFFKPYIKDIEDRRSALNSALKYRKNELKVSTKKRGGDGMLEKPLTPEEYKSEHNKLLDVYKERLISVQQDVRDRLWAVKKANILWWGGAILVAGAVGLFIVSGGAAAMLTQVGSMAASAGSALSTLASAAAAKVTALTALIKEKTASGVGKLALDKIVEWGGTIYSAAADAIKSFTDQLQDPSNQKFLMMSGAAVGVYGMSKLIDNMSHQTDHLKNFTLQTCFEQNPMWGRIFKEKVLQKVDEFRTKLSDEEQLEAVEQSEEQAAPECDETKDEDCLDPDDIENHTRMLSIKLRRNFVERATVNIDWAGCDHFEGGDLSSFLDLRKCVPFFEHYEKITVKTAQQRFLWVTWNDEYDGVVEDKKEKKREQIEWARIKFKEEKKKEEKKKKDKK